MPGHVVQAVLLSFFESINRIPAQVALSRFADKSEGFAEALKAECAKIG